MKIFRKNKLNEELEMRNEELAGDHKGRPYEREEELNEELRMKSEESEISEEIREESEKLSSESSVDEVKSEESEGGDASGADEQRPYEQEIEELKDKYLRAVAEFDNYRKRTIKEKAELILNGSEKAIAAILPVLDDMDRAIDNNKKVEDAEAVKDGMTLIYNKFIKVLESLGVKAIETEGADFNVDLHEAIAMVPGMGDDKKGKVIDCVQKGYKLNDKVIRHAKVAVGQ